MEISQLTPELQAAAAGIQSAAAASVAPRDAGVPPSTPNAAPVVGQNTLAEPEQALPLASPTASRTTPLSGPAPGSFAAKIGAAADKLGIPHGIGGWAKSLVGAAQSALSGATEALGDAATAAEKSVPGEGGLAAVGRIRNAQVARQQQQQKVQTEEDKDRAMIAHENVQTLYQQQLLHKLGDEANHEDIANGKAAIDNFTTHLSENGLQPAMVIAKDITEAQIQKAIANQNLDPSYNHIWPSGSFQPFDPQTGKPMVDKDGQPMLQKTYTVLGNVPETRLDEKMVKLINDNVAGMHFEAGQALSGAQAGSLIQQAMNHQSVLRKIEFDQENADVTKMSLDQKKAQLTAVNNLGPDFGRVLANADGDIEAATKFMTGQHKIKGMVDGKPAMVADPASIQMAKDHPDAFKNLMDAFGGAVEYAKIVASQKKETEQIRKDTEDERIKAQAEKDKKAKDSAYIGDENATGQAFLDSLKPEERTLVESIGTGHVVADRLGYLLSKSPNLVSAVNKAYPEFDSSKAAGYPKAVQDFTSGTTAKALTAGSTALEHLKRLYDNSTTWGRLPGTQEFAQRNNDLQNVAAEIGRFNNGGTAAPSEKEIDDIKANLNPFLRRQTGIQEQVKLISDRLAQYQQQWDNAAPSDLYKRPMPNISQASKAAAAYVLNNGVEATPHQQAAPHGASDIVHSPDGKNITGHIVAGKYVPLPVPVPDPTFKPQGQ
jgi:hypothetical protein